MPVLAQNLTENYPQRAIQIAARLSGADFKAFSLAEHEKFKAVVKTHGLMEK